MQRIPAIYIVTNKRDGVLYIGVTSNLIQRAGQHRAKLIKGFSYKYNCTILVYYEIYDTMEEAILREKQLKGWLRKRKIALIEAANAEWKDLYEDIIK